MRYTVFVYFIDNFIVCYKSILEIYFDFGRTENSNIEYNKEK